MHEREYQSQPSFDSKWSVEASPPSTRATGILNATGESSTLPAAKLQIRRSGDRGRGAAKGARQRLCPAAIAIRKISNVPAEQLIRPFSGESDGDFLPAHLR